MIGRNLLNNTYCICMTVCIGDELPLAAVIAKVVPSYQASGSGHKRANVQQYHVVLLPPYFGGGNSHVRIEANRIITTSGHGMARGGVLTVDFSPPCPCRPL